MQEQLLRKKINKQNIKSGPILQEIDNEVQNSNQIVVINWDNNQALKEGGNQPRQSHLIAKMRKYIRMLKFSDEKIYHLKLIDSNP